MTYPLREYVHGLTDDNRREIMDAYDRYERYGYTGESALRIHTRNVMGEIGCSGSKSTIWMDRLAAECWRFYANKYMYGERDWVQRQ